MKESRVKSLRCVATWATCPDAKPCDLVKESWVKNLCSYLSNLPRCRETEIRTCQNEAAVKSSPSGETWISLQITAETNDHMIQNFVTWATCPDAKPCDLVKESRVKILRCAATWATCPGAGRQRSEHAKMKQLLKAPLQAKHESPYRLLTNENKQKLWPYVPITSWFVN